jgi:predicted dehydrogenase
MQEWKRRRFIAAAGGAIAARAQPGAPARKISTAILGIQHSHLIGKLEAMYSNPDYEVVAYCEPDEATRRRLGGHELLRRLPAISLEEMLADKLLDLVVFEGEVKDAVPLAARVLNAGKHLHLEKPPTNRLEPFRDVVELARARKRKLQLGYIWRFHAGVNAALEAHRQGWLGDVFMIRATINSDRDTAQRAVEARYSGGSMFELGGHMIDRIIAFLGRPAAVRHWLRHHTGASDKLNDNTLAVLEYPRALAVIVSSARDAAVDDHRSFEVIGTDGTISMQPMEPAPVLHVHLRAARGPYRAGAQDIKLPPQPRFVRDFEDLSRAIRTGAELRYSYIHELLLQETLLRASGEIAS